ncbi:gametocyte-specific factor 1-like [Scaptodrosophila lebanonensis]|uniref:Gametocyte-specific factor 1-like n=1 Tax=Drosophila lebanonensis TaxID=7225 RepID=A0A6J2U890_DROLE|nr:gametocyte-specific factor 1-like [Scaptodrosophila lebanonensis]
MSSLKTCPFDKNHILQAERFIVHLVRCQRNHPNVQVRCPHNEGHIIPPGEMETHLNVCDTRALSELKDQQMVQKPVEQPLLPVGESWDDDPDVGTYDPNNYCEQNLVIRQPVNLTKAQRKQFRLKERERLEKMDNSTSDGSKP